MGRRDRETPEEVVVIPAAEWLDARDAAPEPEPAPAPAEAEPEFEVRVEILGDPEAFRAHVETQRAALEAEWAAQKARIDRGLRWSRLGVLLSLVGLAQVVIGFWLPPVQITGFLTMMVALSCTLYSGRRDGWPWSKTPRR